MVWSVWGQNTTTYGGARICGLGAAPSWGRPRCQGKTVESRRIRVCRTCSAVGLCGLLRGLRSGDLGDLHDGRPPSLISPGIELQER